MSTATVWAIAEENRVLRREVVALRAALKISGRCEPLTKRQRELLDFLSAFIATKKHAPSLAEICRGMDLSSLATVHKHLTNLESKGYIVRKWNRHRSIEIVSE